MPEPYLHIARPKMGDQERRAVEQVLESGWLTQGPWVAQFEKTFAERHSVKKALATTSCTTALHLALSALRVGPGDEVIVPAFTWIATANTVVHCGATPVFADVSRDTYNLDPEQVARKRSARTKAVVPVHLFGMCADMDAIADAARVDLVEDAACAAGADYRGRPAGSIGAFGCFSFHPRKSITCGEGGMLTTSDDALAARAETLRNHGAMIAEEVRHRGLKPYELPDFEEIGHNYRMTDIQAAIGAMQLQRLDGFIDERAALADVYDEILSGVNWISLPPRPQDGRHAWQAYVVRISKDAPIARDELLARLHQAGIGARPGTHSVVGLAAYRRVFGTTPEHFPVASELQAHTVAVPLHNHMRAEDAARVADVIRALN